MISESSRLSVLDERVRRSPGGSQAGRPTLHTARPRRLGAPGARVRLWRDPAIFEGLPPWTARIWGAAIVAEFGLRDDDWRGGCQTGLRAVASALDAHDGGTRAHARRVCDFTLRLAREMGVPQAGWKGMALAAILHDVGKLALPTRLHLKEGRLTDAEWALMRQHPALGDEIIRRLGIPEVDREIVLAHHERWDGTGYPRRLTGREISPGTRIFSVADTLDAITTERPYHKPRSFSAAREEIGRASGTQLDPDVVAAFLRVAACEWESIARPSVGGRR